MMLKFDPFYSGLPVQVRDHALKIQDTMPKSDVNKEYYTQNMEREVSMSTKKINFKICHTKYGKGG